MYSIIIAFSDPAGKGELTIYLPSKLKHVSTD